MQLLEAKYILCTQVDFCAMEDTHLSLLQYLRLPKPLSCVFFFSSTQEIVLGHREYYYLHHTGGKVSLSKKSATVISQRLYSRYSCTFYGADKLVPQQFD